MVMREKRAGVFNYFVQKYGARDTLNFWTKQFNEEIPIEKLKQDALDECIRIKVQQILSRNKGIIKEISYLSFFKNWQAENVRRKKSIDTQKVIFGPVQLSKQAFFHYQFSLMVIKLQEKLAKDELAVTESELQNLYAQRKNTAKCIESFQEMREVLKRHLIDAKYGQYIDELVKKAKVEINRDVYEKLVLQ